MTSAPTGWEVAREVKDDIDPRAPLFFLSYARAARNLHPTGPPHDPNRQVVQFFDDLSENVAELVSRPPGADPGFMDRSIPDGGHWTPELLGALGTCQVFVPLLSVPYFQSKWCGMEWHAFAQRTMIRTGDSASDHQTGIIPVVWAPTPPGAAPAVVRAVQRFTPAGLPDPDTAEHYKREGVYGLLRLRLEDAYQAVVWRLAQRIAQLHYNHLVQFRTFERSELRNIFMEERP
jgi:hypothetical protein